MILRFDENIAINKRVHPKDFYQPVDVYSENSVEEAGDTYIYFNYNQGDIVLQFSIDELRAIMRLFDPARASVAAEGD